MYIIWQLSPRLMLCGYRMTKQEAQAYVDELQKKQRTATFEIKKGK